MIWSRLGFHIFCPHLIRFYLIFPHSSGSAVRFRRPLTDVEVRERDVAVLECEVPDESLPSAWYLEDQRLMPSSKYEMEQKGTRRKLTIRDVGADDDGVYLCEMPDGAKSIAELSVKGKFSTFPTCKRW